MYTYYPEPNLDTDVKSKLVIIKHNKQDTSLLLYSYKQVQKKEDITIEGYVDFHKWKSTDSEFILHLVDVGDLHVEPKACKARWCIDVGEGALPVSKTQDSDMDSLIANLTHIIYGIDMERLQCKIEQYGSCRSVQLHWNRE